MPEIDEVTLDAFRQDAQNANKGTKKGMEALKASVRESGAGRSILVASDGTIIAGNKTQLAAIEAGIKEAVVVHTTGKQLIVHQRDDLAPGSKEAQELALADNRVGQLNLNWDTSALKEKLAGGIDLSKLWSRHELDAMFDGMDVDFDAPDSLDDVSEELPGAQALKEIMFFESTNKYGFPDLLPDLLSDMPDDIETWAGNDASNLAHEGWYLYNYGTDSMRGLDCERSIISFYTEDYRFDSWYTDTPKYVSKLLNAGFKAAVTPNYSLYKEDPIALHVYAVFRSRYVGRYLQEAGIPVIPDLDWGIHEDLEFCLLGIPKNAPCLMMQLQSAYIDDQAVSDLGAVLDELRPEKLVLYGGSKEKKVAYAAALPDWLEVRWLESRAQLRGQFMQRR